MEWEDRHRGACADGPRLKRFLGRPNYYSPKARLLNLLGYHLPFDRHDWFVDRCGEEVRCVPHWPALGTTGRRAFAICDGTTRRC